MKRACLGVIDIGSNTIRSLIVEAQEDGSYRTLDDEREVARLAAGLDRQGRLSRAAMRRAVSALQRMAQIARARGAERMSVVATSAIRNAANRKQFVDRVRGRTGLRVRVISEQEEAELAFESAVRSFDLGDRPCAVADVGGGSTEVILALGSHIQQVHSLHLGAVSLTEEFLPSDPVKRREFKAMRRQVRRRVGETRAEGDPPPQILIASGGTATTVAQMVMARQGLAGRSVQGFEMSQAELLHLHEALLRRSLNERREMPGLSPDRADIIIAGVTILYEVMAYLRVNVLRISEHGVWRVQSFDGGEARPLNGDEASPGSRRAISAVLEGGGRPRAGGRPLLALRGARDAARRGVPNLRQHRSGVHEHTYRLIAHAQLDGYTPREREIVALVARFHRRTGPKKRHRAWAALAREDRQTVRRLAALLRIADALDRRHSQRVKEVRCRATKGHVRLTLISNLDLGVEQHAAEAKASLFHKVFNREISFNAARAAGSAPASPTRLRLVRRLTA